MTARGRGAAAWALFGVSALFASAVYRLGGRGVHTIFGGLGALQWTALVVLTGVFVYGEGVMALQRKWVPKLIDRARAIRSEPALLQLLGPLYGMALVGGPLKRALRAWLGTLAIVTAIVIVRNFPEPWRGIVDFAVASALAWGLVSIVRSAPKAFEP